MTSMNRRTQRMASLIQSSLARLLLQEVSDPGLREIIITEVEVSADLKHAKVYFTQGLTPDNAIKEKDIQKGFKRALPFLKRKIGEELELRNIPDLQFKVDTHHESMSHLFEVMDQPENKSKIQ